MILHALTQYYQRKAAFDGAAPEGFENKEIPFVIVLDKQGKFIQLEDTREAQGKKKVGRKFLVPKGLGRSGAKSYEVSNILWDHYGYVLAAWLRLFLRTLVRRFVYHFIYLYRRIFSGFLE